MTREMSEKKNNSTAMRGWKRQGEGITGGCLAIDDVVVTVFECLEIVFRVLGQAVMVFFKYHTPDLVTQNSAFNCFNTSSGSVSSRSIESSKFLKFAQDSSRRALNNFPEERNKLNGHQSHSIKNNHAMLSPQCRNRVRPRSSIFYSILC